MKRQVIYSKDLKPGDRFNLIPANWPGVCVVIKSYPSGHLWCIKFSNPHIVNPPGVIYLKPDDSVKLLLPRTKKSEAAKEHLRKKIKRYWASKRAEGHRSKNSKTLSKTSKKRWANFRNLLNGENNEVQNTRESSSRNSGGREGRRVV